MKICKVSNENLVEDEYRLLVALSAHKVIREKYDDLLDEHDNASVILKYPPRTQVSHDKPHHVSINNLKEFPSLQKKYSALHVEQDGSPVEVNALDHSLSHLPQKRLEPNSSSQKTNLHSI